MTVEELIKALKKAKNQKAHVQITDTEGSFAEDVFTVDEDQDGENVNLIVRYIKL